MSPPCVQSVYWTLSIQGVPLAPARRIVSAGRRALTGAEPRSAHGLRVPATQRRQAVSRRPGSASHPPRMLPRLRRQPEHCVLPSQVRRLKSEFPCTLSNRAAPRRRSIASSESGLKPATALSPPPPPPCPGPFRRRRRRRPGRAFRRQTPRIRRTRTASTSRRRVCSEGGVWAHAEGDIGRSGKGRAQCGWGGDGEASASRQRNGGRRRIYTCSGGAARSGAAKGEAGR